MSRTMADLPPAERKEVGELLDALVEKVCLGYLGISMVTWAFVVFDHQESVFSAASNRRPEEVPEFLRAAAETIALPSATHAEIDK